MYYTYATIRKSTRNKLKEMYPAAFTTKERQAFFYWLIFKDVSLIIDGASRPVHYKFIAAMLGKDPTNFSTKKFIEGFAKDCELDITLSEYSISKNVSRCLEFETPEKLLSLVNAEINLKKSEKEDLVYFIGGDKISDKKKSQRIKMEHEERYEEASSVITTYFRDINPISYNPYYKNIDEMIGLTRDNPELGEDEKFQYLMALNFLSDNLAPHYREPSEYGRVFATGFSLQNLQRDLRKGIMKGTLEADLSSAQLTLAAYLWNIPSLINLLENGVSIWKHLHQELGIPFSTVTKATIKDAVYSVTYGAGESTIFEQLGDLPQDKKEAFLDIPVIKDLREAQKKEAKKIEENKGSLAPQGVRIPKIGNPNRTLVKLMQAYERLIIEEAYKVATKYPLDFRILSHEHDGFTFVILKKDRAELVVRRLEKAIADKGTELGVKISLELKE